MILSIDHPSPNGGPTVQFPRGRPPVPLDVYDATMSRFSKKRLGKEPGGQRNTGTPVDFPGVANKE